MVLAVHNLIGTLAQSRGFAFQFAFTGTEDPDVVSHLMAIAAADLDRLTHTRLRQLLRSGVDVVGFWSRHSGRTVSGKPSSRWLDGFVFGGTEGFCRSVLWLRGRLRAR